MNAKISQFTLYCKFHLKKEYEKCCIFFIEVYAFMSIINVPKTWKLYDYHDVALSIMV